MRLPVCGSVGCYRLEAGGEDGMEETGLLEERLKWRLNRGRTEYGGTEEQKRKNKGAGGHR